MGGVIVLKPGREKSALNLHPWLFSGAIARSDGDPADGDIVEVRAADGAFVGRGTYNSQSQITIRLLTWDADEAINDDFWRARLARAIDGRASLAADPGTTAYRLVHAESDGLPGLIVDRYGDCLVLQALTLPIDQRKGELAALLDELLHPVAILERSDADVREKEGLPESVGMLRGPEISDQFEIIEHGLRYTVDMGHGHKTGFYLDQRDNRALFQQYVADMRQQRPGEELTVLNAFGYTGAFAVAAASAGATHITHVEASAESLSLAQENVALNGFADLPAEYLAADVFAQMRTFRDAARSFDVIVLDPPKFAYNKRQIDSACRGYKDLNLLALKLLNPGGLLFTFSCSGLVDANLFQTVVFQASVDAGRQAQILARMGQPSDHPTLLSFPEGTYLKGLVCRVW